LEETVTVTGESPIVDVQSARRQTVLSNDVLKAIPTVRSYNAMVVVRPWRRDESPTTCKRHVNHSIPHSRRAATTRAA
jgi:hypothetical protein